MARTRSQLSQYLLNPFLLLLLTAAPAHAQFGEIASLATSLLGGALGNSGSLGALAGAGASAGQAAGALGQIGQLYQLAQGALQLTGTGVGVLNQASEGNWFPALLEQTAKSSQTIMPNRGAGGLSLGPLAPAKPSGAGIGPEFGTNFPAPNIEDYDENVELPSAGAGNNTPKPPDGLIDIDSGDTDIDIISPTTTPSTTEEVTLFPEETSTEAPVTTPQPRQIRIQLPDKTGETEDLDYESLITKKETEAPSVNSNSIVIEENIDQQIRSNVVATHGTKTAPIVPPLSRLVDALKKSKLSEQEIKEIVNQVEGNSKIDPPPKIDFNSAVQNIPEKRNNIRQKITAASRAIREKLNGEEEKKMPKKEQESARGSRQVNPYVTSKPAPVPVPRYIANRPTTNIPLSLPVHGPASIPVPVPAQVQIPQVPQTQRPGPTYPGYPAPQQAAGQNYIQPQPYGLHMPQAQQAFLQQQIQFQQQQQQQQAYFQQLHNHHRATLQAALAPPPQYQRPPVMQIVTPASPYLHPVLQAQAQVQAQAQAQAYAQPRVQPPLVSQPPPVQYHPYQQTYVPQYAPTPAPYRVYQAPPPSVVVNGDVRNYRPYVAGPPRQAPAGPVYSTVVHNQNVPAQPRVHGVRTQTERNPSLATTSVPTKRIAN